MDKLIEKGLVKKFLKTTSDSFKDTKDFVKDAKKYKQKARYHKEKFIDAKRTADQTTGLWNTITGKKSKAKTKAKYHNLSNTVNKIKKNNSMKNAASTGFSKTIGAAAILAAASTAAFLIYKRYLGKGAKACAGKTGHERDACIRAYKKQAINARIQYLNRSVSKCNQTKDPQQCREKIKSKISSLTYKSDIN